MPFKSKKQMKWMYANHPEMAKRWADHTPNISKLPEKKEESEEEKKANFIEKTIVAGLAKIAAQSFNSAQPTKMPRLSTVSSRNININKNQQPSVVTSNTVVPKDGTSQYGSNYFDAIRQKAEEAKQPQQKQGFISKLAQYGGPGMGPAKVLPPPAVPPGRTELDQPVTPQAPVSERAPKLLEAAKPSIASPKESLPDSMLRRSKFDNPEQMQQAKQIYAARNIIPAEGFDPLAKNPITGADVAAQRQKAQQRFIDEYPSDYEQGEFGATAPEGLPNFYDLMAGKGTPEQIAAANRHARQVLEQRMQGMENAKPLQKSLQEGRQAVEGKEDLIKGIGYTTGITEDISRGLSKPENVKDFIGSGVGALAGLYSSPLGTFLPGGLASPARLLTKGRTPSWAAHMAANMQLMGHTGNALNPLVENKVLRPEQAAGIQEGLDLATLLRNPLTVGSVIGYAPGAILASNRLDPTNAAYYETGKDRGLTNYAKDLAGYGPNPNVGIRRKFNNVVEALSGDQSTVDDMIRQQGLRSGVKGVPNIYGAQEVFPAEAQSQLQDAFNSASGEVVPSSQTLADNLNFVERSYKNKPSEILQVAPGVLGKGPAAGMIADSLDYTPEEMHKAGVGPEKVRRFMQGVAYMRSANDIPDPEARGKVKITASKYMAEAAEEMLDKKYAAEVKPSEDFAINNVEAIRRASEKSASGLPLSPEEAKLMTTGLGHANRIADFALQKAKVELLKTDSVTPASIDAVIGKDETGSVRAIMQLLRPTVNENGESVDPPAVLKAKQKMAAELENIRRNQVSPDLPPPPPVTPTNSTPPPAEQISSEIPADQMAREGVDDETLQSMRGLRDSSVQSLGDIMSFSRGSQLREQTTKDLADTMTFLRGRQLREQTTNNLANALSDTNKRLAAEQVAAAGNSGKPNIFKGLADKGLGFLAALKGTAPAQAAVPEVAPEATAPAAPPAPSVPESAAPEAAAPTAPAAPEAKPEEKGFISKFVDGVWNKMSPWEQILTIGGIGMALTSAIAGITGTGGGWLSMLGILGGVAGLAPSLLRMVGLEGLFGGGSSAAEPPVEGLTPPDERDASATNPDEAFQTVDENGQNPQPVTQAPISFDEFQNQLVDQYSKGDKAEAIKSFWNRAKTDPDFMKQLKEIQKGFAEAKDPIFGTPMPISDPSSGLVRNTVISMIVDESKKKGVPVSPEAAAILVDNWKQNVAPIIK